MRADLRLCQIRSGQMKKDPPRSESDPLKVHISEIITALVTTPTHITVLPVGTGRGRILSTQRVHWTQLSLSSRQALFHFTDQVSDIIMVG